MATFEDFCWIQKPSLSKPAHGANCKLRQNGFPTNKQSHVKELAAPAVMVAVVPDKEHLALIAGVGGEDDGSMETTER